MLVLSAPVHYTIELTPYCNNDCLGCGNVAFSQKDPLPTSKWNSIFSSIRPHIAHARISGGEPTLHPDFDSVMDILATQNISFTLFSNGRWLNPDKIIRKLSSVSQCRGILISLHGHTPAIHDKYTNISGAFEETIANISEAAGKGLTLATNTIITRQNYNHISDIIALSRKLGTRRSLFSRYVFSEPDGVYPSNSQLRRAIQTIENARNGGSSVGFSVCIPQCFTPSSSYGCLSGISYCIIDPWGNIRPCTHVPINCGNIFEDSLEDIWNGPEMQTWRDLVPTSCREDCVQLYKCRGGCRAMAMLNRRDRDPLMSECITKIPDNGATPLVLYEDAIPLVKFTLRKESFGYVLLNGNDILPVANDAGPFLEILETEATLKHIKERFGQEAIKFIGHLIEEGFVDLD